MSVYYRDQAKIARRITGLILLLIGIFLTVALYYVKTRAQSARSEVKQLERQLDAELAALSVLHAEIAHLENPERLKRLAQSQLGLESTRADQHQSIEYLLKDIPLRSEAEAEMEPEG